MKLLSIGNSFSIDSQRYVREIAAAAGVDLELGNLYIGGCSLERHCENMASGKPAYEYFINNKGVGQASLQTALNDDEWDFITLQQASHFSGIEDTYYPYITDLAAYVRKTVPNAEILVNQTWAYESSSTHSAFPNYNCDRVLMHERLTAAYEKAARSISARIIPVGNAVCIARTNDRFNPEAGGIALTRDGFHLSLVYGRYLAGAVWFEFLTGKDVRDNTFVPYTYEYKGKNVQPEPIPESAPDAELLALLKEIAHTAVNE